MLLKLEMAIKTSIIFQKEDAKLKEKLRRIQNDN